MRMKFAALLCVLGIAAPGMGLAQSSAPGWSYGYAEGAATATRVNSDGDVEATISCRPPDGALVVTDHNFRGAARNVQTAALRIGQGLTINVPASSEGRGRRARVVISLPQKPPILAGVGRDDELSVTVNNVTHTYGTGSGKQMEEVAYACWQGGT